MDNTIQEKYNLWQKQAVQDPDLITELSQMKAEEKEAAGNYRSGY